MPKYMVQGSYTAEGVKALIKETASGRRTAAKAAIESVGGKLESMYFTFGSDDVVAIADLPDNPTAATLSTTIAAAGMVRLRTTPLLTVEEMDKALTKKIVYRAPGSTK